jgi:hypothetical protein
LSWGAGIDGGIEEGADGSAEEVSSGSFDGDIAVFRERNGVLFVGPGLM